MKLLLIGDARADRYCAAHKLANAVIVRCPSDADGLYPHPHDTLIYFGDEGYGTMDALWSRGFSLLKARTLLPTEPPPAQQSLNL